jgi:hypothetical protein
MNIKKTFTNCVSEAREAAKRAAESLNELKYPIGLGCLYVVVRALMGMPVVEGGAETRSERVIPDFYFSSAPKSSIQEAIKAMETNGLAASYDSTKVDYCRSIYNLLENVTLVDDETKSFGIKAINTIMAKMSYDSSRKSAIMYINQIAEL